MKTFRYTITEEDLFENIITDENLILNHVILKAGKQFPKHNTDAIVYMIVVKGTITLKALDLDAKTFSKGEIIHVPYDVPSELANLTDEPAELFVVKIRPE
ncbi:Cupin domain protein [Natronincola peptidivorans]|uniref:Cupin domain protein n=1 Tax=Natronincola peptidivorans TaxID=426128 RepID=A0A1I0BWR0_9FIRM|nr:cupin domain-containing protein [Natronincola peptidivorans]SET11587.1 Cupin domain protein [Natronincola peptidivorans]